MRRCCSDWDAHTHGAQGPQQRRAGRQAQGLRRGQRPSAPADTLISPQVGAFLLLFPAGASWGAALHGGSELLNFLATWEERRPG